MQIVINIPEKLACEGFERLFTEEEKNILIKAIGNGTPLPKGHGRLIDADALKKEAVMCPTVGNAETLLLDIGDVEHAPTIIEADKEKESVVEDVKADVEDMDIE